MVPRSLPKATLHVNMQTLILDTPPMVLLDFSCPEVSWEANFRFEIGVLTQHVIQVPLEASCDPLWCQKCPKLAPNLGPNMVERIDFFALETLLAPSWGHLAPQVAPRHSKRPSWGHLGLILVPFCAQVGLKNVPPWHQNSLVKSISHVSKPTARWRSVGADGG